MARSAYTVPDIKKTDDRDALAKIAPNFTPTPGVKYLVSDGLKRQWGLLPPEKPEKEGERPA